jgi:hypothetical protein
MKTKHLYITAILFFSIVFSAKSQVENYVLDFSDPTTYQITCGSVNSAQWTVNSGTCSLYTPILTPADTGTVTITYIIRINQKGNMTANDRLHFQVKISNNDWYTDTILLGNVSSNVRTITGQITLEYTDFVVFRFMGEITSNGFWQIKNGDIEVNNVRRGDFLPVTLASFSGYCVENTATLEWTTYSEINNDFFTIERSEDGNTFYPAGYVSGAGNSNLVVNYKFSDVESLVSDVTYYRLRQTDYDGTTEVTSPVIVRKNSNDAQNVWTYVENSTVFVNYESAINEEVVLMLFDVSGKLTQSKTFSAGTGYNTFELTSSGDGLKGIYFLRILDSSQKQHLVKLVL